MSQLAYKYDSQTGEFLREVECQESPLEPGVYLQPGHTLLEPPPVLQQFQAAVAVDGAWTVVPDHRDRTFYMADGAQVTIEALGEEPALDWSTSPPPKTLDQIKTELIDQLDAYVAGIYGQYTRFQPEYELREAQAIAFQAANHTGTVPRQVKAFADRAGHNAVDATNLILQQAALLHGTLANLADLRMRKYEIAAAADAAAAQSTFDDIKALVDAEVATLLAEESALYQKA